VIRITHRETKRNKITRSRSAGRIVSPKRGIATLITNNINSNNSKQNKTEKQNETKENTKQRH
jgi:hypothetical protein